MVTITIDIISDITCVWCYIGSRTLTRAIHLYQKTYPDGKNDTFNITWRPYYLDPNQVTGVSVDKAELRKIRLATWTLEKKAAATNRVVQSGRAVGIEFKWGGKLGSTRDAHRLIYLCQGEGRDVRVRDALVEGIFEAFHVEELDVSKRDVLRGIAVDAGLNGEEVDEWLESDRGGADVDEEAARNRQVTTAGVPFFIIQGVHCVDGAQDLQDFLEAFVRVRESQE